MTTKRETLQLTGKAYWAQVRQPNEFGNYTLQLAIDKQTENQLKQAGVQIHSNKGKSYESGQRAGQPKEDIGNFVTLRRRSSFTDKATGQNTALSGPKIYDSKNNEVPQDVLLGNGSIINVNATLYPDIKGPKKGVYLGLGSIQIIDLVEYKKPTEFEPTKGYEAPQDSQQDNNADEDVEF